MSRSFATHSAEAGVSMQSVADQLRHKSMEATRRIYTHVAVKHRRKELDKLEKYNSKEKTQSLAACADRQTSISAKSHSTDHRIAAS